MSKFLEELNIIIKRKKISKNKLAVKIDVDPSSFYQMLAGKRYLNERLFNRLLPILNVSPDEETYLRELYQIMLVGEENYYTSKTVIKFIENLNVDHDTHSICSFKIQMEHINEIVYGRENLNRVIFQILLSAYEKNESLKILCQPDCETLYFLLNILRDNPRLSVEQIICLDSEHNDSGIKNISILEKLIPGLIGETSGFRYSVYYFYDSISTRYGGTSLMPYLIVSDSMGLIFSADFENGLFFEDKETIELFKKQYSKIKSSTSIFTTNDAKLREIKQTLKKFDFYKNEEEILYILCPMIQLPAYSSDFWISLIKPHDEKREELIRFLEQDNQETVIEVEKRKKYQFFTRKGVLDFYETGHIIDGLSDHFLPVPAEKRKEILREILEGISDNRINAFLLKDNAITLSRDFYMVVGREDGINCMRKKRDGTCFMLTFFENALCHTLYAFMENLKKSDLVESRETMISFLEGLL